MAKIILGSLFNMNNAIVQKGKVYTIKAIGLEKQKGIVQVTVPSDTQSARYKKCLYLTKHLHFSKISNSYATLP